MTPERRDPARDAAIIFILALGVRLALALSLPAGDTISWDQSYWEYARNFSEGRGFWMPNPYSAEVNLPRVYAFRSPLFPFLWGCVFHLTHGAYAPIRIAFAFLGAAMCSVAYLAGIELAGRRIAALLAGILCAFYPPLVWHSVHLMTEPLFIPLSIGCICSAFLFRRTGRLRWAVLAGAAGGLATLSRSMLIGFLPLLAIWLWWSRRKAGRAWSGAALFCAAVLITMAPWIIRNAIVFGKFVPATTDSGHGFYVANNARALEDPRGFCIPKDWSFLLKPGETSIGEVEASRRLMHITSEYLRSHPALALRLMARRFMTLWRFCPNPAYVGGAEVLVYALSYIPLFPFMLLGLWRAHARREAERMNLLLVDGLILYTTAIHTVFLAMLRYREPLMPFLLVFAAMGIWCAAEWFGGKLWRKSAPAENPAQGETHTGVNAGCK